MKKKPIILITALRESSIKGDSFSSVAVDSQYLKMVYLCGGIPVIVPLGVKEDELKQLSEIAQGLLISGGVDIYPKRYGGISIHKKSGSFSFEKVDTAIGKEYGVGFSDERDETEFSLVKLFIEKKKPILGICRGIQVINVAFGGNLYQDIRDQISKEINHDYDGKIPLNEYFSKKVHEVTFLEDTFLSSLFLEQKNTINSFHHQAVKEVGAGLLVSARAIDGVIEAVESEDMNTHWVLGVQWHPEALAEKNLEHKLIFEKFIEATKEVSIV